VTRLATFVNGSAFKPTDFSPEGEPVVRIRQLLDETAEVDLAPPPINAVWLTDGDLVFSWSATLAVRFWHRGRALLNQHLYRVDVRPEADRRWFAYVLEEGVQRLAPLMHGSAMTHITQDMLRSLTTHVPPIEEQRAIADYLDRETARIDKLAAAKECLLTLLAERRDALREDLVNQARRSGQTLPLGRLLREVDDRLGQAEPPELLSVSIHKGVIPFSKANPDREARAENVRAYKLCARGDLVLNRMRAFQGGVGVAPWRGIVSPDYAVLRTREGINADFAGLVMRSPWFVAQMRARLRGIGSSEQGNVRTPRVNWQDLRRIFVPVPLSGVQAQLAAELSKRLATLALVEGRIDQQLQRLTELRQGLITAAVTGQRGVPAAA
jgi:type I restriction enzyme S subunit